jgi:hypothetical protein
MKIVSGQGLLGMAADALPLCALCCLLLCTVRAVGCRGCPRTLTDRQGLTWVARRHNVFMHDLTS